MLHCLLFQVFFQIICSFSRLSSQRHLKLGFCIGRLSIGNWDRLDRDWASKQYVMSQFKSLSLNIAHRTAISRSIINEEHLPLFIFFQSKCRWSHTGQKKTERSAKKGAKRQREKKKCLQCKGKLVCLQGIKEEGEKIKMEIDLHLWQRALALLNPV